MKKKFMKTIILLTAFLFFTSAYADPSSHYHLKVYLKKQNVEVFRNGTLFKTIPCSTGIKPGSTVPGKFKIYARKDKDVWVEKDGTEISYYYITKFNDRNSFHSMIEGKHPLVEEGKKLFSERKPSSMGCIRLTKEEAKWIYTLPIGTSVEVIDTNQ